MKLADMKYDKNEVYPDATTKPPAYPWGLKIRLEKPELDKLGITDLPCLEDEFNIVATGCVTSIHAARDDSSECMCIEIQITNLSAENTCPEHDDEREEKEEEGEKTSLKSMLSFYDGE